MKKYLSVIGILFYLLLVFVNVDVKMAEDIKLEDLKTICDHIDALDFVFSEELKLEITDYKMMSNEQTEKLLRLEKIFNDIFKSLYEKFDVDSMFFEVEMQKCDSLRSFYEKYENSKMFFTNAEDIKLEDLETICDYVDAILILHNESEKYSAYDETDRLSPRSNIVKMRRIDDKSREIFDKFHKIFDTPSLNYDKDFEKCHNWSINKEKFMGSILAVNEARAIENIQGFLSAQMSYSSTVVPRAFGIISDLVKGEFIDPAFADCIESNGKKSLSGYVYKFNYSENGYERVISFELLAFPQRYGIDGTRHFYIGKDFIIYHRDAKGVSGFPEDLSDKFLGSPPGDGWSRLTY